MTAPPQQVNGHARPVTLAPLSVHGPVDGWPQQDTAGSWWRRNGRPVAQWTRTNVPAK